MNIKQMILTGAIANRKPTAAGVSEPECNIYSSGKDANGIFTVTEYKRIADASLYIKSELSNKNVTTENYETLIITEYEADGTTVKATETWTLAYDTDNDIISRVKA